MAKFELLSQNPLDTESKVDKESLIELVNKCQERTFAEDIDFIENFGGEKTFLSLLGVDPTKGLNSTLVEPRRSHYGSNQTEEVPPKTFFGFLCDALEDFTLRVLLAAAFVSIITNMIVEKDHREIAWIEGFAIFMAVMLSSMVTAVNDYKKDIQFRRLNEVASSQKEVTVWRDGRVMTLHGSALVTGDIVKIQEGMNLDADMMLIESFEITTDESALTGEPEPVRKATYSDCIQRRNQILAEGNSNWRKNHSIHSPILMSGTLVLSGEGRAVVLVVGKDSCVGKIRALVQEEDTKTPLQEKLEVIAKDIGKFGLVSAIITLSILLLRFLIDRITTGTLLDWSLYIQLIHYVIIAITVIVVAIPEGLPLAVTLSLAYSVRRMLKENNLVRKLEATETMGGANNICSDKTGTLTQNKMTLTSFWNGTIIQVGDYDKRTLEQLFPISSHDLIKQALACNSSALLRPRCGSITEIALLEFLERFGEDSEEVKDQYNHGSKIIYPFTSQRKRMSTIIEISPHTRKKRIHTKGAPEMIIPSCSHFYSFQQDHLIELTQVMRDNIEREIERMADQALRTICIAYKDIEEYEDLTEKNDKNIYKVEEDNFILLAILGIRDVLRKEVKTAVAKCKRAGIKVRMVTGDSKITAKAIARECGIIGSHSDDSLVLTGAEFMERVGGIVCSKCRIRVCDCPRDRVHAEREGREMRVDTIANPEEFDRIYPRLDVLARSRPEDKYVLVAGLIERGAVVAVTGDGTNDAPALKKAHVGFAMNSGTDVAKEAADIIILDNNFASIVEAVKWGRNIYDNIRKFLQFQLTVNIVAVGITLLGAAILKEAVLSAVQLLWVNLIMDTLASLALATESPTEELLKRKPYDRNEYIVSKKMLKHISGQAVYQFIIIFIIIFTGDKWIPESLSYDEIDGYPGELKYYSQSGHVRSGRAYMITNNNEDYKRFEKFLGPSRHFTFLFNTFVFLQVFNFLNCRKIQDEINVFKGITQNNFFLGIVSLIIILQVIFGTYGGLPLSVSFYGLDLTQWTIAILLSSGCLIWSVVLKLLPLDRINFQNKDVNVSIEDWSVNNSKPDRKGSADKNHSYEDISIDSPTEILSPEKLEPELLKIHVKTH